MPISALSQRLERGLLDFAWNEWAQLGVLAEVRSPSPWTEDIEALLVLTFEVARADPRLFDEVLDWLVVNEHLLSVRRLRSLTRRYGDETLLAAILQWVAQHRPQARFAGAPHDLDDDPPQRLFFDADFPIRHPDAAFLEHGWLRPEARRSGKASPVAFDTPVALGLRLRRLLGTGARAEVVRFLLCTDEPRSTAPVIASSVVYTKRNVQEALYELVDAGVASSSRAGQEVRYGIDRRRWADLLGTKASFPIQLDWTHLLGASTRMVRALRDETVRQASDYLQASAARTLVDEVRDDLHRAGIAVPPSPSADESLQALDDIVDQVLRELRVRPR